MKISRKRWDELVEEVETLRQTQIETAAFYRGKIDQLGTQIRALEIKLKKENIDFGGVDSYKSWVIEQLKTLTKCNIELVRFTDSEGYKHKDAQEQCGINKLLQLITTNHAELNKFLKGE